MSRNLKVLSFDLDDTLWPCLPTILHAEKMLYRWLQNNVSAITDNYNIEQLRERRYALLELHPELTHDLTRLRIKSFEYLAAEFKLSEEWIIPAFEMFYDARQQVTLFDDVKPVLDELKKHFRLVSVTNGNADTVRTGVDHWFELTLNSAAIGKKKSQPDIYREVQKITDIEPQQMVHIGDHPLQDVSGAKSAGALAVWLNREQKRWDIDNCQPDAQINSLHELPDVLITLDKTTS